MASIYSKPNEARLPAAQSAAAIRATRPNTAGRIRPLPILRKSRDHSFQDTVNEDTVIEDTEQQRRSANKVRRPQTAGEVAPAPPVPEPLRGVPDTQTNTRCVCRGCVQFRISIGPTLTTPTTVIGLLFVATRGKSRTDRYYSLSLEVKSIFLSMK